MFIRRNRRYLTSSEIPEGAVNTFIEAFGSLPSALCLL